LIKIDKTVLTQHYGDLAAWPIYMTIGNLDSHTRRQQKRPALILIGFMPIMEGYERLVKAKVYYHILRMIFKRKIIFPSSNSLYFLLTIITLLMYLLKPLQPLSNYRVMVSRLSVQMDSIEIVSL
jgi:hypothetical protein